MTTCEPATTPSAIRDELTALVHRDLLGPAGGPEEELDQIEDNASGRYLVGMLAPLGSDIEAELQDSLATGGDEGGDEGEADSGIPAAHGYFPSAMGLSFMVAQDATEIIVQATWGQYKRIKSQTQLNKSGQAATVCKRIPVQAPALTLPLIEGTIALRPLHTDHPLVQLQGRMRRSADGWVVSLFMLNGQALRQQRSEGRDDVWLFQPKLAVSAPDQAPVFVQRSSGQVDLSKMDALTREETETLEMLYRHQREFSVGHGVSVHATRAPGKGERALQVETEWIPCHEVPQQTARTVDDDENLAGLTLNMVELAEFSKEGVIASLRHIETAYRIWIKAEQAKLTLPAEKLAGHERAATLSVQRCTRALQRIKAGIDLIDKNPLVLEAFRFANRAMYLQRQHATLARKVRKKELTAEQALAAEPDKSPSWRLFQMAFVLLNLPALLDLHHPDRSHETEAVADLLWFATGGGKTEAYLGLTAFVLAMRRLQGDVAGRSGAHGVAVLMRYTLRLLTLQQFQRAATLICACESIRRADPAKWGTVPFRLGLWVGNSSLDIPLASAAAEKVKKQITTD